MDNQNEQAIFSFNSNPKESLWNSVNDSVMGGVSNSQIIQSDKDYITFTGNVSLDNNGGFASIRSKPRQYDLGPYKGLKLRVKGDGKTYKFRLRDNPNWDGPSFQSSFITNKGVWQEFHFEFKDFVPTFRGRQVMGLPPLDTRSVYQFGFLISDKQEGTFHLDIDWIKAF